MPNDSRHVLTIQIYRVGRGSKIVSRMANFFPERFIAYAFLAAPYSAPRPMSKIDYTLRKVSPRTTAFRGRLSSLLPDQKDVRV